MDAASERRAGQGETMDALAEALRRLPCRALAVSRWARKAWRDVEVHYRVEYLVYDPAVSPHFEVMSVPRIFHKADRDKLDPSIEESEWPPSQRTYRVIEPPVDEDLRSEKGVYCAVADFFTSFASASGSHKYNWRTKGPWIFQGINYFCRAGGYNVDSAKQAKFEWDSDEDNSQLNVLQIGDTGCKLCGSMDLLGFHPYKEVIFFCESMERAFAYHLNSSKVQDLGKLYPRNYCNYEIRGSFPYTPCYISHLNHPLYLNHSHLFFAVRMHQDLAVRYKHACPLLVLFSWLWLVAGADLL
ncbi:hypothetical protein PVAP13_1NG085600 [Panicum virgatum]|uniref:Uncharacterized protein n=1 Tax=Panicum virgatum TaxID=38727 RepID=A0A8T0WVE5_PANVG|nr:hypothetical protein PVAP13_1NG085600 [Panicum virgatum]